MSPAAEQQGVDTHLGQAKITANCCGRPAGGLSGRGVGVYVPRAQTQAAYRHRRRRHCWCLCRRATCQKKEHTRMTWHDGEREVLDFWACSFILKNIRTVTDWHSRLQRDKLQREACVRIGANPRGTKKKFRTSRPTRARANPLEFLQKPAAAATYRWAGMAGRVGGSGGSALDGT